MKYTTDNISFMADNRDELSDLGKWIKVGLDGIGKNQAWLAKRIGVQPPQVSRIMRGLSEATPDLLNKIADSLGKPRIQIYRAAGHIETATPQDELDERILHALNSLPIEERRKWARSIEANVEIREYEPRRKPAKSANKTRP